MITPVLSILKVIGSLGMEIPKYVQERLDRTKENDTRYKISVRERSRTQFDEKK
jgi:phage-related holin